MTYSISPPDGNGAGRITLDGYLIPNITVRRIEDGDKLSFVLDNRFGFVVSKTEDLEQWLTFIATAMAVSAGKSCFGKNSSDINPFRVQSFEISACGGEDNGSLNKDGGNADDNIDLDDIWRNALE